MRPMHMQGRPSGGALSRAASLSLRSPLLAKPCLPRALNLKPASRVVLASAGGSGGSSGNLGGGGGGGGGGGSGGGDSNQSSSGSAISALLLAAGRTIDSFPADFAKALADGKVTLDILKRYLFLEKHWFYSLFMPLAGFRERLLADTSFFVKLGIEVGIGICTKITAEYAKRQNKFWQEADFVFANIVMAIIADFMLTWLPAPTLSYRALPKSSSALSAWLATLPDNAFQRVQPGMPAFSVGQRFAAILRNGAKLFAVGTLASLTGVSITNGIIWARQKFDPSFTAGNAPQDILPTSLAYGTYMSVSSNLRYQIVAGIVEERGIEVLFKGSPQMCHLLSFAVRTANTFLGSLLWIDFVRLLGMQSSSAAKAAVAPVAAAAATSKKGQPAKKAAAPVKK